MKILFCSLSLILFGNLLGNPLPDTTVLYKIAGETELSIHLFFPSDHQNSGSVPAIIFLHGGGWRSGSPSHFYGQCEYFADRGLVAASVQYRLIEENNTTPAECVMDAKSAMRWLRSNAAAFGIDPDQIIAGGGSAGGHLAAATAILKGFNEAGDDTSVSSRPQALVLFNPVLHNDSEGYGFNLVRDYWEEISPYHNLHKETPPTLIMLGTEDKLFTPQLARAYKEKMEGFGLRCDLILYEGQQHGFFNRGRSLEMFCQTMIDADTFLISLGFLTGKPKGLEELMTEYAPQLGDSKD